MQTGGDGGADPSGYSRGVRGGWILGGLKGESTGCGVREGEGARSLV